MRLISSKVFYFICSVLVWIGVSIVSTACFTFFYQPKVPNELLKK